MLCPVADKPPMPSMPLTPDYGGPVVSYADGILDVRFISVREGKQSRISLSSRLMSECSQCFYLLKHSFIWS